MFSFARAQAHGALPCLCTQKVGSSQQQQQILALRAIGWAQQVNSNGQACESSVSDGALQVAALRCVSKLPPILIPYALEYLQQ